jgi:hypothetical protein
MTKRKNRNREDWKTLIETQLESGLSAAEFCRQQQVNAKYFSKRKTEHMRLADTPEAPPAFVKIQSPIQTKPSASIHLHYKNARLQIPSSVGSAWLADLLGLLP